MGVCRVCQGEGAQLFFGVWANLAALPWGFGSQVLASGVWGGAMLPGIFLNVQFGAFGEYFEYKFCIKKLLKYVFFYAK